MRPAWAWLIAVVIPGAAAVVWEFVRQSSNEDSSADGIIAGMFMLYVVGFAVWSVILLRLSRATSMLLAGGLIVVSLPFGAAAASLGFYSVFGPLIGFGGLIASLVTDRRAATQR